MLLWKISSTQRGRHIENILLPFPFSISYQFFHFWNSTALSVLSSLIGMRWGGFRGEDGDKLIYDLSKCFKAASKEQLHCRIIQAKTSSFKNFTSSHELQQNFQPIFLLSHHLLCSTYVEPVMLQHFLPIHSKTVTWSDNRRILLPHSIRRQNRTTCNFTSTFLWIKYLKIVCAGAIILDGRGNNTGCDEMTTFKN